MKRVFLTGMSGTGKSAVISELAARGYKAIDTDYDGWSELVDVPASAGPTGHGAGKEWLWPKPHHELLPGGRGRDDIRVRVESGISTRSSTNRDATASTAVMRERSRKGRTTRTEGPDERGALALRRGRDISGALRCEIDTSIRRRGSGEVSRRWN